MSSQVPGDTEDLHDRSLGELLKQLSEQTTRLVHQELELAKAELTEKGKQAGAGAGLFGGAGALGLAALGALTACFILALDAVMPAWLAALIVAVIYGIIAFVLVKQGQAKLKAAGPPVPRADHRDGEGGRGMGQEPDAIRQDIAQTRTELGETVEAVGYKADVPSRAKEAVSDKVENMKSKVSDTATRAKEAVVGTGSRAGDATPSRGQVKQRRVGGRPAWPRRTRWGWPSAPPRWGSWPGWPCPRPGSRTRSSAGCPIRSWTRSKRPARRPWTGASRSPRRVASTATETAKEKTQEHGQELADSATQNAQDLGAQTSQTSRSQTGNAGTRRPRSKPPQPCTPSILDRQIKRRPVLQPITRRRRRSQR